MYIVPYSSNGKRKIRDPFKDKIDSSRTVVMIQREPWSWTNSIIFITIAESRWSRIRRDVRTMSKCTL
jgi:hypothetical protein